MLKVCNLLSSFLVTPLNKFEMNRPRAVDFLDSKEEEAAINVDNVLVNEDEEPLIVEKEEYENSEQEEDENSGH
jgi:hypothetical protein